MESPPAGRVTKETDSGWLTIRPEPVLRLAERLSYSPRSMAPAPLTEIANHSTLA